MSLSAEHGASAVPGEDRPPTSEVLAVTERILHSETFRRCPRLRDFLTFVVQCSVHDRVHEINEYSLGVQVFGKSADYNPNQDNIVRATARQLRAKLAEYYSSEGALDTWLVEIPKGAYVPVWRPAAHAPAQQSPEPVSRPALPAPRTPNWVTAALALTTVCSLIVTGVLLFQRSRTAPVEETSLLTGLLADPRVPPTMVLDDPYLPVLANWAGKPIGLKDYLEKHYLSDPAFNGAQGAVMRGMFQASEITSASTAQLLVKVARAASARNGQPPQLRHCGDLQVRDLTKGNFIFFGGVGSNPWVELLQKNANFQHFFAPNGLRGFRNRNRLGSEPAQFVVKDSGDTGRVCYARVAILKNPMGAGQIALIGGTSRLSTEAAGDFALSHSAWTDLGKLCPEASRAAAPELEVILETTSIAGAPVTARVVAHRCASFKTN
jgi:hypothetical protein